MKIYMKFNKFLTVQFSSYVYCNLRNKEFRRYSDWNLVFRLVSIHWKSLILRTNFNLLYFELWNTKNSSFVFVKVIVCKNLPKREIFCVRKFCHAVGLFSGLEVINYINLQQYLVGVYRHKHWEWKM